ncbi:MAG: signal peptidase I [Clostridia bacterium]|nr:signal peptidase I [Clostridia bacterium]
MFSEASPSLYIKGGKSKFNIVLNVLIALIALVLALELLFVTHYTGIYVVDVSMTPTLNGAPDENSPGGDYVYVNRSAKPDYGDIVVVTRDNDSPLIKRVIAFGGDSVKIIQGKVYIKYKGNTEFNEDPIEESYIDEERNHPDRNINNFPQVGGVVKEDGYFVEEGKVFLLGDNRDYSSDSRQNGAFDQNKIYGVVTDWSMKTKKFSSAVHKFFNFDLPRFFGVKK